MENVLIISYFFPPCNLTASQRAFNWAKYLKEFGYNPIVITRKWDQPISVATDLGVSSLNMNSTDIKNEKYRVIHMPYKASIKDKIYINFPKSKVLRKTLSFIELIVQNYTIKFLPYVNIFNKSIDLINQENIKKVIITGTPFPCFHFGFLLKKEFKNIKWIADYRDDWTTTELVLNRSLWNKLIFKMDQKSEKKWIKTANAITSVSQFYVNKISNYNNVNGYELINGFDEEVENLPKKKLKTNKFVITYNGSLYDSQKIEPVLEVIKELIITYKNKIDILLNFPGLAFDPEQSKRVKKIFFDLKENIIITQRLERKKVLKIQQESHLLLMISHENIKGIPSSKLYEYIGLKKPILLYPNDKDIIEKTLNKTNLGIICNTKKEVKFNMKNILEKYIACNKVAIEGIDDEIKLFTRKNQVKKLGEILDAI